MKKLPIYILFFLLFSLPMAFAEGEPKVKLDADSISFEEATGVATAEGNVQVVESNLRLFAPFVEYDSVNQRVKAVGDANGAVTFMTPQGRLDAEMLEYDFITKHGLVTRPSGRVDKFYVRGSSLETMPITSKRSSANNENASSEGAGDEDEEMGGVWRDASITTCNKPHPHYRLEAQSLSTLPGRRVVIKKPAVYLGDTKIFAYPFDYIVPLYEHAEASRTTLFPKLGYDSDKGGGIGVGGSITWNSGSASLNLVAWTEDIYEGDLLIEQQISEGFYAYANMKRAYDKYAQETLYRPAWGLKYQDTSGWKADLKWSQRELVTIEKHSGQDSNYVVWKEPEVNISGPWKGDEATGGYFRLLGSWGRYEDATFGAADTISRYGLGAQLYGEVNSGTSTVRPFYNLTYLYYGYDADESDQQVFDTIAGVRWNFGNFNMKTAYFHRFIGGNSPMAWDAYEDREEVYQEVSVNIPTNSQEISWNIGVRGAYDFGTDDISEMVYKVGYDQHCLLWEAVYRDDKAGGDDWVGLTLTIKAYPDKGARLMGNEIYDPTKVPDGLEDKFSD